jgi:hypothetical protein
MCIFHQKQIMRRYITKTPKLEANKELQDIWLNRKMGVAKTARNHYDEADI